MSHDVQQGFLEQLEHTAARLSDKPALVDATTSITYSELIRRVDERAHTFRAGGLRVGDRVVLIAENSAAFLITAFAVWKAGGVLVTIYPSSGISDIAYSIGSSDAVLVIVDEHTDKPVREAIADDHPITYVDDRFEVSELRHGTAANPEDLRAPLHLICYTSGTTSRPKAIMLSEEAVLNGARTYAEVWHLDENDVTLVCLPMAWLFGLSTTSMATLAGGGTVVILRRSRPELLAEAIHTHKITFFPGVTTLFAKFVAYLDTLDSRPDLSSLRLCISGGEPRNETAFDRWAELSGCPVHDTFCASECFPLITYDPVADPYPVRGSAGKLVPRSEIRIVDADGNDVAPGEVGEALVRGPGLMLGYWGDDEQTAAAITPDGYYRQKDLVRIDENGYVYVVGRLSDMIIRGGSNISPAEVERVLRDHPSVHDVSVVGLPDEIYGQQVVAAVVTQQGWSLDPDALSRFAATQLASYKVPTQYFALPHLPQNSTTGKVDRRQVAAALETIGAAS